MVNSINWRKGDLEIKTTNTREDGKPYVELLKHFDSNGRDCVYVVAYFRYDNDGYASLVFVGDRPFTDIAEIDIASVWKELFLSQMMLNSENT